jgi:hypothetical protein
MERMLGIARFQQRRPEASTQKQKRLSLKGNGLTHKPLFLLYSYWNVTVQAWTKTHANFNKLVEAKYDDKEYYESLIVAWNNTKEVYTDFFDKHVTEVAKLTNMEYAAGRLDQSRRVKCIEDVASSLLDSQDKDNVKRACFIVYFSWKYCYNQVFQDSLAGYYEDRVLEAMNATYQQEEYQPKAGCVNNYGVDLTNDYHTKLKSRLTKTMIIRSTCPKE